MTFDSLMTFKHHARNIKTINIITDQIQGHQGYLLYQLGLEKEVLLTTYKAIGRSQLNYACPVWTPMLSNTEWEGLQVAQNTNLRAALGYVTMTGAH
ncbi:MAG: hypothetical protein GY696_00865 [Gammaproteobacteria bacterium]|nr:hypothetical protein [Gammaproteobacteria bacterium]